MTSNLCRSLSIAFHLLSKPFTFPPNIIAFYSLQFLPLHISSNPICLLSLSFFMLFFMPPSFLTLFCCHVVVISHHDFSLPPSLPPSLQLFNFLIFQTTGVELPEDFIDFEANKAITSLILQLLNTDPVE